MVREKENLEEVVLSVIKESLSFKVYGVHICRLQTEMEWREIRIIGDLCGG